MLWEAGNRTAKGKWHKLAGPLWSHTDGARQGRTAQWWRPGPLTPSSFLHLKLLPSSVCQHHHCLRFQYIRQSPQGQADMSSPVSMKEMIPVWVCVLATKESFSRGLPPLRPRLVSVGPMLCPRCKLSRGLCLPFSASKLGCGLCWERWMALRELGCRVSNPSLLHLPFMRREN